MGHLANNVHNAALFRLRQVLSGIGKEVPTSNEQEILDEIKAALPAMNEIREQENAKKRANGKKESVPYEMPTAEKSLLGFSFLDALLKVSNNPDYFSELPRQTTQAIIKEVRKSIVGYFAALREYKANPAAFVGKPKLPYYRASGGIRGLIFTNQDCKINDGFLKFPKTQDMLQLGAGVPSGAKLKEVKVKPYYGNSFLVCVVVDDRKIPAQHKTETPSRIAAIDFGIDNIIAMANNIGQPGLLIKGGVVKSANQWFNKKKAEIVHGITSGKKTTFCPTSNSLDKLSAWRDGLMRTELHTYAKWIIDKCAEWNIDTLVLGINHDWKQGSSIGHVNNQNFVSIPHAKLRMYLTYLAEEVGIRVVEQEESFTSKASFLDMDVIPVFGEDSAENVKFSGYRKTRGCYWSKVKKKVVNADLNGAGNILRKAFPNAFDGYIEFKFLETCIVLKHVKNKNAAKTKKAA